MNTCLKIVLGCFLVCCLILNSGCSMDSKPTDTVSQNLVIQNFDFNGNPMQISFSKVPERVIVARPEILDIMKALHVEKHICAAYITKDRKTEIPELQKEMPNVTFYTQELDRETALMEHPDFILGWRMSFRKGSLGDTAFWNERHTPTYIEENSGPVPAVTPFPPSTVESEIQFIRNLGQIFHKTQEANELVEDIKDALKEGRDLAANKPTHKVITIEFMKDKIEVFGDKLLSGDIIQKLGSQNINYDIPFISREELRVCNADTIFIVYHEAPWEAENALAKLQAPEYQDIPAVKNHRVFLLPYKNICASHVHTAQTIREIANGLYS